MPANIYEVISLGARYWFVFLGLMIVWRAFSWLRKDRRAKHRRLRHLPDAGMIGEMVVLCGSDELPEGTAIPVPRSGVLGFLRTCDVTVPVSGVSGKHVDFTFQDGKGLILFPLRGRTCYMDDYELTHRSKTKHHPMCHGSRLQVGDAVLRLRLFEGLETEWQPTETFMQPPFPQDDVTQDWQDATFIYHQQPAPWQEPVNPWQQEDIYQEEPPQEESWLNPQSWQPQELPPEPFEPAQARQHRSRFERRRYDEQ